MPDRSLLAASQRFELQFSVPETDVLPLDEEAKTSVLDDQIDCDTSRELVENRYQSKVSLLKSIELHQDKNA